jgi:hypothetical protein
MKKFADMLSTRCKNTLVGCFGERDIIYHPEKIAAGRGRLTLARNIGAKGLKEIARALYSFGYIDDVEQF